VLPLPRAMHSGLLPRWLPAAPVRSFDQERVSARLSHGIPLTGQCISLERAVSADRNAGRASSTRPPPARAPRSAGSLRLLLTATVLPAQNRAPCGQIGGTGWKYASTSF
jgi:hypothetical protein